MDSAYGAAVERKYPKGRITRPFSLPVEPGMGLSFLPKELPRAPMIEWDVRNPCQAVVLAIDPARLCIAP